MPQFDQIVATANGIAKQYAERRKRWEGSPFLWLKSLPSKSVGSACEKIVEQWLRDNGLFVARSPTSDADRLVNGHRVEIKSSTLWEAGIYNFQQIRDQDYEALLCLGLSPHSAHAWVLRKDVVTKFWSDIRRYEEGAIQNYPCPGLSRQHGGQKGEGNTLWLQVDPNNPQDWLKQEAGGGDLDTAIRLLSNVVR